MRISKVSICSEFSRSSNETDESFYKENNISENTTSNSLFEDIKKGALKLKKIETQTSNTKRDATLKNEEEKILKNSLMEAIRLRRIELTKNDIESDASDSDWSD